MDLATNKEEGMTKKGRGPEESRHLRMVYGIPGAHCKYTMGSVVVGQESLT